MRTIKFSEEEISSLHKVYLEKLAQAEKDIQRIKDVLKKLEVSTLNEPIEEEQIVLKRGRKSKVKVVEPKVPKKRGRKPKAVIPTVESIPETIVKEPKKRGRKPKTVIVEPKAPKKRGGKPKVVVPIVESVPVTAIKEPKKRGRKPKTVNVSTSEPKKRGRKPKVSNVPTAETSSVVAEDKPKKRGRKPRVSIEPASKEEKKIIRKKSPYKKRRKGGKRITLKNLKTPLKLKEPKKKAVDENTPELEPIAAPTMETIIAQIEEKKE
jgi:hypothetical protein